ncbi:hypothetical protein PAXINDRAFT_8016 [Paxillus involutus ATCC 200175]|nr:hypothetical protein PAXINDRAFT_8016 [Paxillus involutus ATCC 200175]
MSEMSFSSHHSKRRRLTQSGHYSGSGSAGPSTSTAPPGSPNPAFYWSMEAAWTPADQADWEVALARLTASVGLPLQWIENLEWKKICDCFLSKAKNLSLKVLTDWIIPEVLNVLKASAQLHTIHVHDASNDPKTVEELLKQMLLAISNIKTEWGATVVACTTDASGESVKAWRLLWQKLPHLVVPDCLAHQWNLIVGDLFKVKDDYAEYGDMVQDLIMWLRSKTQVLGLLCEIQMASMGKTLAIIRAVLTRWLTHYLTY